MLIGHIMIVFLMKPWPTRPLLIRHASLAQKLLIATRSSRSMLNLVDH